MLLAFDGKCVMCNGFVLFLLRHDKKCSLRFTSNETVAGAAMFTALGQDPASPISVILQDGVNIHLESDAIIRAIIALGGAWRSAAALLIVPRVLRNPAYRFVAGNRYRWFGRHDRCALPDPAHAHRFLD